MSLARYKSFGYTISMKPRHKFFIFTLVFSLFACSKDAGEISITMDVSSLADPSTIQSFVFVVSGTAPGGETSNLLFPNTCVGCMTSESPCKEDDKCFLGNNCGFSITKNEFRAQVEFSDFLEGGDITVIACALDSSSTTIGSGQSVVTNAAGNSVTISVTADTSVCTLPPSC